MRIFLDTEYTGLHQQSTLISLALYFDEQNYLYAEFNDFEISQINSWLKDNVMDQLEHSGVNEALHVAGNTWKLKGSRVFVKEKIEQWIAQYPQIEIWADCYAWDWVLFCELWGGSLNLPKNIFFMPMDLATLFKLKGLNPDTSRFQFVKEKLLEFSEAKQHHALWDAKVEKWCYENLIST